MTRRRNEGDRPPLSPNVRYGRNLQVVGDETYIEGETLRLLRDRLGSDFTAGVVLHCGERTDRFGDRLLALPVTALWAMTAEQRRRGRQLISPEEDR